jgi:hypothetical protein
VRVLQRFDHMLLMALSSLCVGLRLGGWALGALGGRGAFVAIAAAGVPGAALFSLLRARGVGEVRKTEEESTSGTPGGEMRGERPEQAL